MITAKKQLRLDLSFLLTIIVTLIVIGFIFIYSSSSVFALEKMGSATYFVKKQLIGLVLGILGLIVMRCIPLETLKKYTPLLFFAALGLTCLTLVPFLAQHVHGSSRWLKIGIAFQPSELLKIFLIMYIAYFVTKKEHSRPSFINGYLPILCILGITSLILLRQPDFGLTVTLATTVCALLFIAQFHVKYLLMTLLACIPGIILLVCMKAYRLKRILTFLNPWADPQGAGFQIIQSLIAIGSGGFWGLGIGQSKQKFFYLPMQHTDFIFSIIAEETGFVGAGFLILLYLLFLYFGLRIAMELTDQFCKLTMFGFVILISLQATINIAVATGLAPTKGIGLPFVSYGNTALICQLLMVGIIINMVANQKMSH
jgi:cell division protein FtsW